MCAWLTSNLRVSKGIASLSCDLCETGNPVNLISEQSKQVYRVTDLFILLFRQTMTTHINPGIKSMTSIRTADSVKAIIRLLLWALLSSCITGVGVGLNIPVPVYESMNQYMINVKLIINLLILYAPL